MIEQQKQKQSQKAHKRVVILEQEQFILLVCQRLYNCNPPSHPIDPNGPASDAAVLPYHPIRFPNVYVIMS